MKIVPGGILNFYYTLPSALLEQSAFREVIGQ
jgi:hypothetical protein